jgi:uncharacterized protein YyaL (SSP411 family)
MRLIRFPLFFFAALWPISCVAAQTPRPIAWQPWSNDVFQRAGNEHKFVLLDLGTQWCHWCHVMDVQTYVDPTVQRLIAEKYIPVRVDADARPDLADRYEDYGWPATIVYNANAGEIVKRRGFLSPQEMASMLQAIIDDPTPGPSVTLDKTPRYSEQNSLSQSLRDELIHRHVSTYDWDKGGWGHGQKFLDWNNTEWAMRQAAHGDSTEERMARQMLTAQLQLLDPAWGGVYQYSTDDDWTHPHFEKIMQMQAEDLFIYSLAYAQWHDPTYLDAANSIHRFLIRFLHGPDGGFYTSQDADLVDGVHSADYFKLSDARRTALGIPRVDTHQYARENGWAIRGLVQLYEASGDQVALGEAIAAAKWACDRRAIPGGGFIHDLKNVSGPYLGDTLAMGEAFLELYAATADRTWLARATQAADFIAAHFQRAGIPGVMTADVQNPQPFGPQQEFDENVDTARWTNLLSQYTGRESDKALAQSAMRYLATPDIALSRKVAVAGVLLANDELATSALHIAIVGSKSAPTAAAMFRIALTCPSTYKRVEWYDSAEGPLPNSDVQYPNFPKPAAFVCTGMVCSRPAFSPDDLARQLQKIK